MSILIKGKDFGPTEQVTSTKLDELVDNASFTDTSENSVAYTGTTGTCLQGGGLEVTSLGQLQIADSGVNTSEISDSAVTTVKIADSNVTTAKIANLNVTTGKIANDAVTQAKIANDAVGADQLASNAVVTASIVDSNVTTAKIADDAVTPAKTSFLGTVDTTANSTTRIISKQSDGEYDSVTPSGDATMSQAGAITITGSAVTTAKIADANVTTAKIADDAITSAKIADNAINSANMITGAVINTSNIVDDAVTSAKIANNAVTTAKITDLNVTTAKIAADAITTAKIADDVELGGNPTTTTQSADDNSTKIATTAFVQNASNRAFKEITVAGTANITAQDTFVDMPSCNIDITANRANRRYLLSGMLGLGAQFAGTKFIFKWQYRKNGSGSWVDFTEPTSPGSRISGHFEYGNRMDNNGSLIGCLSYKVRTPQITHTNTDTINFKLVVANTDGTANINLNSSLTDANDANNSRVISQLEVEQL